MTPECASLTRSSSLRPAGMAPPKCPDCPLGAKFAAELATPALRELWARDEGLKWRWARDGCAWFRYCARCHQVLWPFDRRSRGHCTPGPPDSGRRGLWLAPKGRDPVYLLVRFPPQLKDRQEKADAARSRSPGRFAVDLSARRLPLLGSAAAASAAAGPVALAASPLPGSAAAEPAASTPLALLAGGPLPEKSCLRERSGLTAASAAARPRVTWTDQGRFAKGGPYKALGCLADQTEPSELQRRTALALDQGLLAGPLGIAETSEAWRAQRYSARETLCCDSCEGPLRTEETRAGGEEFPAIG